MVLEGRSATWFRLTIVIAGLTLLGFLATTRFVDHHVGRLVYGIQEAISRFCDRRGSELT